MAVRSKAKLRVINLYFRLFEAKLRFALLASLRTDIFSKKNFKDYLKKYVHGDEGRIVAIEGKKG